VLTSGGFTIRPDASLMISTTVQPGAVQVTRGWSFNPDGSLFTAIVADTINGHYVNSDGFRINANGSLVTNAVKKPGAVQTSDGFTLNPNGAIFISGTLQPGAVATSRQLTFNPDGSLFAY
jgi:sugar lactone lactonase YvrE